METEFSIESLVAELRTARANASGERDLLARVRVLAQRAAICRDDWLRPEMCVPDPAQGFGICVLHEEVDHQLAVFVASWLPDRGTPPHDHGTWAVVAGLEGTERNSFWKRVDDRSRPGYAETVMVDERTFAPGDILVLPSDAIHSVWNDGDRVAVSLHIYGQHVNYTQRSRFDPINRIEAPYLLATVDAKAVVVGAEVCQ